MLLDGEQGRVGDVATLTLPGLRTGGCLRFLESVQGEELHIVQKWSDGETREVYHMRGIRDVIFMFIINMIITYKCCHFSNVIILVCHHIHAIQG